MPTVATEPRISDDPAVGVEPTVCAEAGLGAETVVGAEVVVGAEPAVSAEVAAGTVPVVGAEVAVGAEAGLGAKSTVGGEPATPAAGALTWTWQPPFPLDLLRTLSVHRRGSRDPAFRVDASEAVWRTSLTPEGPATVRLSLVNPRSAVGGPTGLVAAQDGRVAAQDGRVAAQDGRVAALAGRVPAVHAAAWGPGAAWLIASVPALLGADDDRAGFAPAHPIVRELFLRYQGVRISRSGRVLEALVPAVLEQKVVGAEAGRAWRFLLLRFGDRAPGPAPPGMRVSPAPDVWRRIPSWEWHRAGAEAVRARTVIGAARVAARLEEITTMSGAEADRRLRSLPGIGQWTSAEVRQRACGDPDAVSVGDYHLPGAVGWALAGRKVDDAGMLELLAPYAGHRHRVARLIELSGIGSPRRGPRLVLRDYRSF